MLTNACTPNATPTAELTVEQQAQIYRFMRAVAISDNNDMQDAMMIFLEDYAQPRTPADYDLAFFACMQAFPDMAD